jgi:hypothetical protein
MSTYLDLLIPPIIVGILILTILSLNTRMMESQIDTRLTNEMQQYANAAMSAIQEELREVDTVISLTDSTFSYLNATLDTVRIFRQGRDLMLRSRSSAGGAADTTMFPARLTSLRFNTVPLGPSGPTLLRVLVESESIGSEQMSGSPYRQRAFAQRDFFLRNID